MRQVLIANRGEIAVRVARACKAAGLRTTAVYSEADRTALHVRVADDAVCVGPPPARESYLDIEKVLAAAKATGADAIHPGYGFLSENAEFAEAVARAGLTWIGPPPAAITAMGSKIGAREKMVAAGVPVVPGEHTAGQDPAALRAAAERVGYPLLVKASAGGGGKGMRAVHTPAELGPAIEAAQREAKAAFGDASVYLERLLENPRHIEIQVFGDAHGQVVHLGERECSIQRRHQKVVEEAPSVALDPALRARMGEAAIAAARAVDYVGAGTIELMLDDRTGDFYFLEMNTRLQVEHPVTELAYGVDLVDAQLRVAQGQKLPWPQERLVPRGWAIEVRLYAEDPAKGFLPSTGALRRFRPPVGPGIRLDSGYVEGDEVPVHYDPMLAKLIAWGEDREHARGRLAAALDAWEIHGVTTNLPFLAAVVRHPAFASGALSTGFIGEHFPDGLAAPEPSREALIALALADALGVGKAGAGGGGGAAGPDPAAPWHAVGAWRGAGGPR
ncbi:MAG: acetyl-CoA carboxylase biotin carboxylase subunit [Deltaproteobacteria bacterium]|nr:acetyl-CoA carboxylase biotin carboxylase subunit [Deltaproteobacteria bacterium]